MTRLETQVLDLLREDCRLPLEKLAVMLGVSTEEVAETIDSLERRRVILHYAPTINWDLTDRERVEAMIQVSVTPQRDMGFDAVARRIYRFEEVKSVYLMSGGYDLLVLVEAKSLKELASDVTTYPQELLNIKVADKAAAMDNQKLKDVIAKVEDEMHGDGRVLVRPSGTEPLLRIMAEAPTEERVHQYVERIGDVARAELEVK